MARALSGWFLAGTTLLLSLSAGALEPWKEREVVMRTRLARDLAADGYTHEALTHLDRAIELAPDDWRPQLERSICRIHMGQKDDALGESLEKIIKKVPDNGRARYFLGLFQEERGRYDRAMEVFQDLLRRKPGELSPRRRIAEIHMARKEYREALSQLKLIVRQAPDDVVSHSRMAEAYELLGEEDEAERTWIDLSRIIPGSPYPHHALARFYRRRGWFAPADRAEARAKALYPVRPGRRYRTLRPAMGETRAFPEFCSSPPGKRPGEHHRAQGEGSP